MLKHGYARHDRPGGGKSPTYNTWCSMIQRCTLPTCKDFKRYGARGIIVCGRWLIFENFLTDMGERPIGKTIDRYPNAAGNYEPGNCRWATPQEQSENRRNTRNYTLDGKTQTLTAWERELGLAIGTIWHRINKGWSITKALTTAKMKYKRKYHPKITQTARKTHCKHGHELAADNLYIWQGERHCKACGRLRAARYRTEKLNQGEPA
jgi:hypothetical protein